MSVLPIVERELRVASRRPVTFRTRFWFAVGMLGTWLILLNNSNIPSPAMMGQHLLNGLGVLALAFSMLAGVFLTSDCLSEEKREGTLGLLFLTDLKAYDVVIGKLAANSLHSFFGLLAVFPILGLTLLLGGVTGGEFCRLSLVFVVTLFFSLSLGMVVSAVANEAKQALSIALLWLVIFAGIMPALWWFQWTWVRRSWLDFLLWPSPVNAYIKAFDLRYRFGNGQREFWQSVGTLFGLGLAGIVAANIVLPRSWQVGNSAAPARPKNKRPGRMSPGDTVGLRQGLGWADPMYWLAVRDASPQLMVRRRLILLIPLWAAAVISSLAIHKWMQELFIASFFIAYVIHLLVKVLLASEAGRRMNEDRRIGAWELLLVTPLKVEAILDGQRKALIEHFKWALLALCAVNTTMMLIVLTFHRELDMDGQVQTMFCEMFFGGMLALLFDFHAITWVGMWRGLNARVHHRAVLATVGQILAPQWIALFFLILLQPRVNQTGAMFIMAFWFGLGFVVDIVGGMSARQRLRDEFRTAVLGKFQ